MTLTLRNIPLDLDAALQKQARQQGRTVDQVAVDAMKVGLGLSSAEPDVNEITNLAASIRGRFAALGGIEIAEPVREPMRAPLGFDR